MHRLTLCPALRLVIPFILGILFSGVPEGIPHVPLMLTLASALCAVILLPLAFGRRNSAAYGIFITLFFFITGADLAIRERQRVYVDWPEEKMAWSGTVADWPRERARSCLLQLELDGQPSGTAAGRKIYLYVPKDSLASAMEPGMRVSFYGAPAPPDNDGTPDFDYAAYLYRKGVSGTLWVPSRDWKAEGRAGRTRLKWRALALRHRLLASYAGWGFNEETLGVVSAVTLGSRDAIGDELREVYSDAGASHVLAVSGLHVGIMYAFLTFLFPPFMNVGRRRWIRESVCVGLLWCYAFVIGMPLSITRSLIMFTLLGICRCCGRESSSVNSLAVAALIILMASPSGLYDPGFELSFSAVLFILLYQPLLGKLAEPRTAAGKYVWDIVTVSVAAQLGTSPLVMILFTGFSTYFLITNLFAIPLMFLVVSLSMVLWLVCWIPVLRGAVVWALCKLTWALNRMLEAVVSLPGSRMDVSIDSWWTVAFIYALLFLLHGWLAERDASRLTAAIAVTAAWSVCTCVFIL